jgi:predicted O-methyltransferase YrrM
MASSMGPVTRRIKKADKRGPAHCAGSIGYETLAQIEELLGSDVERTAETGCGRSTILFSNLAKEHYVFCVDDTALDRSSVSYFSNSGVTNRDAVHVTLGPTQETLVRFAHAGPYDAVLLDGPHGYPFPELEYFHFYPRIRAGGLLIVDDVQIATIGRLADVLQEDAMWRLETLSDKTAIFRRTHADTLPPTGDDWYAQDFNRRRTDVRGVALHDGGELPSFAERLAREAPVGKKMGRLFRKLSPFR